MNIDPNLATMMTHLAELAIPSATATFYNKVDAITRGKANEQTVNELKQIINDLIKERNDLVAIAQTYEQELVAQRISDKDIKYIIDSVLPVLKTFIKNMPTVGAAAAQKAQAEEALDILERLLSVDMLTVLQLLGFNYKRAIGEPLTVVIQKLITTSISRLDPQLAAETARLNLETGLALTNIAQDEEAFERSQRVLVVWRGSGDGNQIS